MNMDSNTHIAHTTIDGVNIRYLDSLSPAPAVLLIHGWGRGMSSYTALADRLIADGFRVIIPDLPGFGKSDEPPEPWNIARYTDFIKRFIAGLELSEITVIGHSFGGQIAVMLASDSPIRIQKLVLYGSAIVRGPAGKTLGAVKVVSRVAKRMASIPPLSLAKNFLRRVFHRIIGAHDYANASETMKATLAKVRHDDLTHLLPRISTPTLIIWGEKDTSTPLEEAHIIHNAIKGSTLKTIPEATHLAHKDRPDKFYSHLIEAIKN